VSARLGHANVTVTATVYAHVLEDAEARQRQRVALDATYGAAPTAALRAV
jgi:hypothetical protein